MKSKSETIIRQLDNFDEFFWPRYRNLIAIENDEAPENIAYPAPLKAIRQIAGSLIEDDDQINQRVTHMKIGTRVKSIEGVFGYVESINVRYYSQQNKMMLSFEVVWDLYGIGHHFANEFACNGGNIEIVSQA